MNKNFRFPIELKRQIEALTESLQHMMSDPEQEITGIAVTVMDAVIESTRLVFPDHLTVRAIQSPFDYELLHETPMRAADALLVVQQIDAIIGPRPISIG